jgi:23S rRNA (pseudouridine1915-N3)-methyltransferase
MKIECWFIGKTRESYVTEGISLYHKRLNRFLSTELVELKDSKLGVNAPEEEATIILNRLNPTDSLYLLDEKGKQYNSKAFALALDKILMQTQGRLIFLIGGAYGFHPSIYERAKGMISLSAMTMNHQLIRVVLLEQLYRAGTILNNHPYHNE